MRCQSCGTFSLGTICKNCKDILSQFTLGKRVVDNLNVYYFYNYSDIKHLLLSKHHLHGLFIYKALANLSFKKFAKEQNLGSEILAVPIDDAVNFGYSHTAILARSLKNNFIRPSYNTLKATSKVSYSGKSLTYRQKHKRNFKLTKKIDKPIILVDDIITTGTTLSQAYSVCKKSGINTLFALVLADARE